MRDAFPVEEAIASVSDVADRSGPWVAPPKQGYLPAGPATILWGGCPESLEPNGEVGRGRGAGQGHGQTDQRRPPAMNDVTRILSAIEQGDPRRAEQLLPLVYEELRELASRKLAHEKPGQTLQPTALVHEAYLRLVGSDEPGWNSRGHFFAAAAEAMRRILIEQARRKRRLRHGGGRRRVELDQAGADAGSEIDDLLAVDQALDRLAAEHPDVADSSSSGTSSV